MSEHDRLRERVASFPRWHYEFDLGGVRTPIFNRTHVNRHAQRREYFFAPLIQLCGGSLAGKRVLDLGCNAGFWSLAAVEAGAELVVGVDGRQMHVDQANLVFEAKGVDRARYQFLRGDVFTTEVDQGPFDVVLCLGLLYHVSNPFGLMDRIAAWSDDLVVIDTTLSTLVGGPFFRLASQNPDDPRSALDRPIALHPTSEAVANSRATTGITARCCGHVSAAGRAQANTATAAAAPSSAPSGLRSTALIPSRWAPTYRPRSPCARPPGAQSSARGSWCAQ